MRCYVTPLSLPDVAVSNMNVTVSTGNALGDDVEVTAPVRVFTNAAAQIRYRLDNGGAADIIRINTHGWIDRRGQDA
jgi:hypothetical protein